MSKKTNDKASQELLEIAQQKKIKTVWDRYEEMQPQCRFGRLGLCCKNCLMGPCRINPERRPQLGICGADADIIAARNLVRMIASGASAHSDHGRDIAHLMLLASEGKASGFSIKDKTKLVNIAREYGISPDHEEVAKMVAEAALSEFGKQEGELTFLSRAPKKRQEVWRKCGIAPRGIDREVVEIMHRTHIGVDNDYKNILMQGMRVALSDGWGGSMIATDLSDILFGSPTPIRGVVNLGVLEEEKVNIVVHGHEPSLPDVLVEVVQDPEIIKLAKANGANGINLVGICCTANEILMRHGIPLAGNFLQQELAIITGLVDLILVDVQCILPSLGNLCRSYYHTKFISTSPKAKFPFAEHIEFNEEEALPIAKRIVKMAIENYKNRNAHNNPVAEKTDMIAGFTAENIYRFISGKYRWTYRPLNNAIIEGRLRGLTGIVGCNNPKVPHDWAHVELAKELIKRDVLVVVTGCAAMAIAKAGLLRPEAAFEYAGKGLQEICEAVGIPPVMHVGACVDNSRILVALCNIVQEGGLGDDISDVPVAAAAPEWMSEKAVAIAFYAVASGIFTVLGLPFPIFGSQKVVDFLTKDLEGIVGATFAFESDPLKMAELIIEKLNKRREKLKLRPMMYQK